MTPESILEAMARALAEKYTATGPRGHERPFEERFDQGMMDVYRDLGDGQMSMSPPTPREAAVEAMNVVGPVLDKVSELKDLLARAIKLLGEWAQDLENGPGPEFDALLSEVGPLMAKLRVQEPADWDYVRRFSATPNEIHDILRHGLHPNVYLAYQQALGEKIVAEAAEDIRKKGEEIFSQEQLLHSPEHAGLFEMTRRSANYIDPKRGGGPYPENVVSP